MNTSIGDMMMTRRKRKRKRGRRRWAEHATHIGKMKMHTIFWLKSLN
jgi:hypothetical protein